MKRRSFILFSSLFVLVLLLGESLPAAAQMPQLSRPTRLLLDAPPQPSPIWDWESQKPSRSLVSGDGMGTQSIGPAVALGQPGFSFRYVQTFGVTEEAYPADAQHLNFPNGIFIDGSDNLYVVEGQGSRILKFDPSGSVTLTIGRAGSHYVEPYVFAHPQDVALDYSGNIWVVDNHRVTQYDPGGSFLQVFPDWSSSPWNAGDDNQHFNSPGGIAFDSAGRMYISDERNHRIQVYTFVGGSLVYSTTIGVTGISGNDNAHFNRPAQIAIDSSDRLYVADVENFRVQRCTYAAGWTCVTFHGTGSEGGSPNELSRAYGLGIDNNDNIYIADSGNARVKKCDSGGNCSLFASGFALAADVAIDSASNVYVSDWNDFTIPKYDSSGSFLGIFAGISGVPYVPDTIRLNMPRGIAVALDGSIYVTEHQGFRLVKLNAVGTQQWAIGRAGVQGDDNARFGYLQGNVAIDAVGRIYVPDTGNNRIQIFDSNGTFLTTLGSYGSGNFQFDCPAGVAISPVNGDIFVADTCNQRVQVFTSDRSYKATLGVTDESGSDNAHFNGPQGVAVDANGNIYVADSGNHRVQKCTLSGSSGTCTAFVGETGVFGEDFGHLHPLAVAVDRANRVYVADEWNNRVQVFDASGGYLTTIGGSWGSHTGRMRSPSGVAVDGVGNVYMADRDNQRIQKFAPGVPGWVQVNINGFGDRNNWAITRMAIFGGHLYASTANDSTGGEVWRSANGTDWSQVNMDGFGVMSNTIARVGQALNGYLYVSMENSVTGAEIWRCATCDAADWRQVVSSGFGDRNNPVVERIIVFSNTLYATTNNSVTGVEVWKSSTGARGSWTQCNVDGFGDAQNTGLWATAVFNGYLYVATAQWEAWFAGTHTGIEVWRTSDGITWDQVNTDGFGNRDNISPWLEPFNGYLYVLAYNSNTGAQIWRCAACDGTDWQQMIGDGFSDRNNTGGGFMLGFRDHFYVTTDNNVTGAEVWQTANGTNWSQVNIDGFGDSNNVTVWSGAVFNNRLFLGTRNDAGWRNTVNGGEVWLYLQPVFLPVVMKNH